MADAVTDGITMIATMAAETEDVDAEKQDVCPMTVAARKQGIPVMTAAVGTQGAAVITAAVRK